VAKQESGAIQVRLLGPVEVVADGTPRQVSGLRRKAVLATLALHSGDVVDIGHLANVVWGDAPPPTALNTLQTHVSYLRGILGSRSAIVARAPGYVLDLQGDGTDVRAAERLLREGTRAADPAERVRALRLAQGLWRGRPLADVSGLAWLEQQAERLDVLLVRVRRALCEARLAAGEHAQLVPELERMVAEHPLDEQVCGQLMVALYRSGRQADALAAYHRLRGALVAELGIDPGQALRDLETAILRQDQALAAPGPTAAETAPMVRASTAAVTAPEAPMPAQLPLAVPGFAGREAELASLDATLAAMGRGEPGQPAESGGLGPAAEPGGPGTVVISAVSGTAGVGKTALAVHWAHRVAGRFPDGQLYVNLRAFDPGGAALDPAGAVRGFLDALGVPVERIPRDLEAQAGLYRSLLAGRRMLVLLDNAKDSAQVRPLLPGSPGCMVLVTSRNQLAGLVAAEGAAPLTLGLLTTAEARALLAARLGADRTTLEPEAVATIIDRCARLPLALTVAAARAATRPGFTLAAIAAELSRSGDVLDPFDGDDLATNVRAVFSWSYRALSADAARLFRLLGLHPGPDITVPAAASLAAIAPGRAQALLAELTRASMIAEHRPRRYAFHDLLRAYAADLAQAQDTSQAGETAVRRLVEHHLHTAHAAVTLTDPDAEPITLDRPLPGVIVDPPAARDDALAWFTAEHRALLAAVQLAASARLDGHVWQLAWTLRSYLLRRGLWGEHTAAWEAGLDAARRAGDTLGEAHCLRGLASGYVRSGRFADADPLLREALRLLETIGGHFALRAATHGSLIQVSHALHRPDEMLTHSVQTVEMYRAAGNQQYETMALNDLGFTHALLGNYTEALGYCQQALTTSQELGQRTREFPIWHSLGYIHHQLGDHEQAVTCYERSAALCRQDAQRFGEADALTGLGDVHHSGGDLDAARRAWSAARRIFDEIGHPLADQVRAKLQDATEPARR
jgi:DNA-binding SARP family transcriptional activator/tetratricopeptide (TPR) repeat protein